jgi:hypothetical protein
MPGSAAGILAAFLSILEGKIRNIHASNLINNFLNEF